MSETTQTADTPKPGSDAARERGCSCAVLDNGHGLGAFGDGERYGWWVSSDCPLHGWEEYRSIERRSKEV